MEYDCIFYTSMNKKTIFKHLFIMISNHFYFILFLLNLFIVDVRRGYMSDFMRNKDVLLIFITI